MRQYEPIWIRLKQLGEVRLAVPRPLHARIIKAITKEKWMDSGFRFLLSEDGKSSELEFIQEHNVITVRLIVRNTGRFLFRKQITLADI